MTVLWGFPAPLTLSSLWLLEAPHPSLPPPLQLNPATANPAPLGLYGFALTTALLQGAKTQLTEPKGTSQMAVSFGFFFGGLAQFCAGLLEYQRRNTFGTVAFCW